MCLESNEQRVNVQYTWLTDCKAEKNIIVKFDKMKAMKSIYAEHSLITIGKHSEKLTMNIIFRRNGVQFSCLVWGKNFKTWRPPGIALTWIIGLVPSVVIF